MTLDQYAAEIREDYFRFWLYELLLAVRRVDIRKTGTKHRTTTQADGDMSAYVAPRNGD